MDLMRTGFLEKEVQKDLLLVLLLIYAKSVKNNITMLKF